MYPNQVHGTWDCPGDGDYYDYVDQGHVCKLDCRDGGVGGIVVCLGHGVWDHSDLTGCS